MTLGTVVSRATGLARLAAITAALGIVESGHVTDTYNIANTAPNILYELILGGVITSVFVPVFVELLEKEGRERAWEVASAIINLALVVLTAITVLGIVTAPWIARFYASSIQASSAQEHQVQVEVLTFWLRTFFPQIIFYGLYAMTSGLLNAHRRFGPPMYTPVLNNLAVIAVFIAFHFAFGAVASLDALTPMQLVVIGVGTTLGVFLQAVAQIPFLRGLGGYRFTLSPRHPSIRRLGHLAVFMIGYVIANQIGYLVVQKLAYAETGGYSAYVTAFTFYMLPHGLFAVSIITALLPSMSQSAVNDDYVSFRERLTTGIRATFFLILPAAIGYFVLAEPILDLLLNRGVMTIRSVDLVAVVLRFFVLGLVQFSIFQLLLRAYYALQDTRTPFFINCGAVALNTAINIPMFHFLGVEGLAAGHALAYTFGMAMQAFYLGRRLGGLGVRRLAAGLWRTAAAGAGMGAIVYIAYRMIAAVTPQDAAGDFGRVLVPVLVGVVAYGGLAVALRVEELSFVRGVFTRRLHRD
jgi:putative peptidoglycan lipid II flippase